MFWRRIDLHLHSTHHNSIPIHSFFSHTKKTFWFWFHHPILTEKPNPWRRKCCPASRSERSDGAPPRTSQSTSWDRPKHAPRVSSPDTLSPYCTCNTPWKTKPNQRQLTNIWLKSTPNHESSLTSGTVIPWSASARTSSTSARPTEYRRSSH